MDTIAAKNGCIQMDVSHFSPHNTTKETLFTIIVVIGP
jgi:hypothetical protein